MEGKGLVLSSPPGGGRKDLWGAAAGDDEMQLRDLLGVEGGCSVDERDDWGRTPLHVAASEGAELAVRVLIEWGADPNCPDKESRWTPLHRALYNGHVKVALLLLRAGAVLGDELTPWATARTGSKLAGATASGKEGKKTAGIQGTDADGNTPLSLLSWLLREDLKDAAGKGPGAEVFTFGRADWPLGYCLPNNASYVQKPRRVDTLSTMGVIEVSAAKHHSAALTDKGEVYTWGHGRGGRLGHGDETPRMFPERVTSLTGIIITKISASESHTAALSKDGSLFTWGSDRFGQLGHGSPSAGGEKGSPRLQPRMVEALRKVVITDVSAGSMHTAAVANTGELYTWGCNKNGQLGYDIRSTIEGVPRVAHMLYQRVGKCPRIATQVSAGSSCTLVIVAPSPWVPGRLPGQEVPKVYQFGYGSYVPMRVDFRPAEQAQKSFTGSGGHHTAPRIHITQVAVAMHHNVALSKSGLVYTWGLGADQLGQGGEHHVSTPQVVEGLGQDRAVYLSTSAGHTCVVTDTGDLYTWGATDGQGVLGHGPGKWQPTPKRVVGLKRVTKVAAGPEHTVVISTAVVPELPHSEALQAAASSLCGRDSPASVVSSDDGGMFDMELDSSCSSSGTRTRLCSREGAAVVLTLKQLAERTIASHVDMKNAVSVLAHAESLDSPDLANFCVEFITRNLDGILIAGRPADLDFLLEDAADDVNCLLQKSRSMSEDGQAVLPGTAEEEEDMASSKKKPRDVTSLEEAIKWERGVKKRLAQVVELEVMRAQGVVLHEDQARKIARKAELERELTAVESVLGRLRIVEAAKMKRMQMSEAAAAGAEAAVDAEKQKGGNEERSQQREQELLPRMCEVCGVKCASPEAWNEHLSGRRHKKRVANLEAEAKEEAAAPCTPRIKVPGEWPRGCDPVTTPASSPWCGPPSPSTPSAAIDFTPPTHPKFAPRKSFRQILEEEEEQQQAAQQHGKPSLSASPVRATKTYSTSGGSSTSGTPMAIRSLTLNKPVPSPSSSPGGVLLSSYLPSGPSTPVRAPWAMPSPTDSTKTAAWGGWSSKEKKDPAVFDGESRSGGSLPSSSAVSFEAIMAEEEKKAFHRFTGNDSPWYRERRERADSFEVIQSQQAKEEARLAAEAAAAREKEEREKEEADLRRAIQASKRKSAASKADKNKKKGESSSSSSASLSTATAPAASANSSSQTKGGTSGKTKGGGGRRHKGPHDGKVVMEHAKHPGDTARV